MLPYLEYATKVSLSLAVSFLFYRFLLKPMTYYSWNRYFLLLVSILSFIAPLVNVGVFMQEHQVSNVSFINKIPSISAYAVSAQSSAGQGMVIYWKVLTVVFVLVSFILVLRLAIQFLSLAKIKSKATLLFSGEVLVYHVAQPTLPFSFLNSIFINTNNYSENELQEIISHEQVHVQEKHSIDMLVAEMICIVNWYNPFAWMIKNAVRENLEFIADESVIKKGADKKRYQYLLLKVTGDIPASITSGLKFSALKNRIRMMNKTKTSRLHLLKFVLLIPVITVVLLAFRNSKESTAVVSQQSNLAAETFTLSTLTYSITDAQVKSIVINEQDKSLLRPGGILNLALLQNEKGRLEILLKRNGYTNLKSNAIRFLIDTASGKNSFSIEIKINLEPATAGKKRFMPRSGEIFASVYKHPVPASGDAESRNVTGI